MANFQPHWRPRDKKACIGHTLCNIWESGDGSNKTIANAPNGVSMCLIRGGRMRDLMHYLKNHEINAAIFSQKTRHNAEVEFFSRPSRAGRRRYILAVKRDGSSDQFLYSDYPVYYWPGYNPDMSQFVVYDLKKATFSFLGSPSMILVEGLKV